MLNSKGKQSNIKSRVKFIALGVFLLLALVAGLVVWYVFLPAFKDLIICLGIVFSLIISYFLLLRGVFLNANAGYFIDEKLLVIKDGYPNSKKHIIKLNQIKTCNVKQYKIGYLLTACIIFGVGLVVAVTLAIILKLNILIVLGIIVLLALISGYFLALHFLSKGLGTLKLSDSEKFVSLKSVPICVLLDIVEKIEAKGGENEI